MNRQQQGTKLMLMSAISGAEMAMRDVGIKTVGAGVGVAAAEEYYRLNGHNERN